MAPAPPNINVRARILELAERAAVRTEVTVASLTKQLIEDRDFARSLDNAAAAVTASAASDEQIGAPRYPNLQQRLYAAPTGSTRAFLPQEYARVALGAASTRTVDAL
jgi:hypothetical protein